jgi:hypothetical protein
MFNPRKSAGPLDAPAESSAFKLSAIFPTICGDLEAATSGDSVAYKDSILDQEVQDALKKASTIIGFDAYDSGTACTFYVSALKDGTSKAYGPKIGAFGNSLALVWSQQLIEIPEGTPIDVKNGGIYLNVGEKKITARIDLLGCDMPVSVDLMYELRPEDEYKKHYSSLLSVTRAEQLAPYLQRVEPVVKWGDIAEGSVATLYAIMPVMDLKEPDKIKYCHALASLDGRPVRIYCPGDQPQEWASMVLAEGYTLTKTGPKSVESSTGQTYELKGGGGAWVNLTEKITGQKQLKKGEEVKVGKSFLVIEVGMGTTNDAAKYAAKPYLKLVIDGEEFNWNTNADIANRYDQATQAQRDSVTTATPATFVLESLKAIEADKMQVKGRLIWPAGHESELEKRARQQNVAGRVDAKKELVGAAPW